MSALCPGISCLDFGELSRVATIICSLRDKPTSVLMVTRMGRYRIDLHPCV
jgi:hypothetical protein